MKTLWNATPSTIIAVNNLEQSHRSLVTTTAVKYYTNIIPDELKLARVIPVYKCNDKQTLSNYRPISILTLFSKVLETVMYKSISKFLDSHSLIHDRQFGFRNNHSTTHAIITLVNKITESDDSGDIAINLFIDLRKAFDTVSSHPILIKKNSTLMG